MTPWLSIVGIGEEGRDGLSRAALSALDEAALVVGGRRHLTLAAPFGGRALAWPRPLEGAFPEILGARGTPVCVLATGDPFHHGIGPELVARVPRGEWVCFPQPSAFSLAAARLGWALQDCACVSLHGRALERIVPLLQPGARVLALSWDGSTPTALAALLRERGLGTTRVTVLDAMGGTRERRRDATAATFDAATFNVSIDPLNVVALEVQAGIAATLIALAPGRSDSLFRHDGQITKAPMRALTLAALAPQGGALLWDVGAGSGSVSVEWCLAHPLNRAIAVERAPARIANLRANAHAFGVIERIQVVEGSAPAALEELAPPQAVFLGGGASDPAVFSRAWAALPSGGRMVVNAVTLETEARLAAIHATHGGVMLRVGLSQLDPVGGFHGWRPAMPVTQWTGVKP